MESYFDMKSFQELILCRVIKQNQVFTYFPLLLVSLPILLLILFGHNPDLEEMRTTLVSTWLGHENILKGIFPGWSWHFGLGSPALFSHHLVFHPLFFLHHLFPSALFLQFILAVHLLIGNIFLFRILLSWKTRKLPALLAALTFSYNSAIYMYGFTDFWVSEFVGFTLFPVLFWYAQKWFEDGLCSLELGSKFLLILFFYIVNTHIGHWIVYTIPTLIYFIGVYHKTLNRRKSIVAFSLATLVAVTLLWPHFYNIIFEASQFNSSASRLQQNLKENFFEIIFLAIAYPLYHFENSSWLDAINQRHFFIGAGTILALMFGLFTIFQKKINDRWLILSFYISIFLMFVDATNLGTLVSNSLLFRDPAYFFGSLAFARICHHYFEIRPFLVRTFLGIQVLSVSVGVMPIINKQMIDFEKPSHWNNLIRNTEWMNQIDTLAKKINSKIAYSNNVHDIISSGAMIQLGVFTNSQVFNGLEILNVYAKGPSYSLLQPTKILPYGQILLDSTKMTNSKLLALVGVEYLVATEGEQKIGNWNVFKKFNTSNLITFEIYKNLDFISSIHALPSEIELKSPLFDNFNNISFEKIKPILGVESQFINDKSCYFLEPSMDDYILPIYNHPHLEIWNESTQRVLKKNSDSPLLRFSTKSELSKNTYCIQYNPPWKIGFQIALFTLFGMGALVIYTWWKKGIKL
jgi:hypothetical protein